MGFVTVALNRGTDKQELASKLGDASYVDTSAETPAETYRNSGACAWFWGGCARWETIAALVAPVRGRAEEEVFSLWWSGRPWSRSKLVAGPDGHPLGRRMAVKPH